MMMLNLIINSLAHTGLTRLRRPNRQSIWLRSKQLRVKLATYSLLLASHPLQADAGWAPIVYFLDMLRLWYIVLLGLLVKVLFLRRLPKFPWEQALKAGTLLSVASFILGWIPIAVGGIIWGSLVFKTGLFTLLNQASANLADLVGLYLILPVLVLINCLIEIPLLRYFYPDVDHKQSFKLLVVANVITGLINITAVVLLQWGRMF